MMLTAVSWRGRATSAMTSSWAPNPFATSRITPSLGRSSASTVTRRRTAVKPSWGRSLRSQRPRFNQPGAGARKKSEPMLS